MNRQSLAYGEEYPPLNVQSDGHHMPLQPGEYLPPHLTMPQSQSNQQQGHYYHQGNFPPSHPQQQFLPPGFAPQPPPGFHQPPEYMFKQHPPPPAMFGQGHIMRPPFLPPPPPPGFMMQRPMYSEMAESNLPPPPPQPFMNGSSYGSPRPPAPQPPVYRPVAAVSPQKQTTTGKTIKKTPSKDTSPSRQYYKEENVYNGDGGGAAAGGSGASTPSSLSMVDAKENVLSLELEKTAEMIAVMFPHLSKRIHSTLLCLVIKDLLDPKGRPKIESTELLNALYAMVSQPDSFSTRCHQKLISLKEDYLDGKPFEKISMSFVSFQGGKQQRQYPQLASKSKEEIAAVAQELAMMLPAALKPCSVEPLLERWKRQPSQGWIELDTAAANAAQSRTKHAKLVDTPVLLRNFATTDAARELATACLKKLESTCAILTDGASGSNGLSELYLYGEADFGVQTIINPIDTWSSSTNGAVPSTSPSELLTAMLTTGTTTTTTATASKNNNLKGGGGGLSNALEFRHLTLERSYFYDTTTNGGTLTGRDTSGGKAEIDSKSMFVIGGCVAPQLPCTFTTIDTARLFWSDRGDTAIKLDPGQQHTLTIALCRLNGPERDAENGILQQAAVVFIAVGAKTEAFHELGRIQGASFVDVYSNYDINQEKKTRKSKEKEDLISNIELGMEEIEVVDGVDGGGNSGNNTIESGSTSSTTNKVHTTRGTLPVATLGTPKIPAEQPLYRIFACARPVSVALLDAGQLSATTELRVDAKPFIPPRWKKVFDTEPAACYATFDKRTMELLVVDEEYGSALVSAATKKNWATSTHLKKNKQQHQVNNIAIGDDGTRGDPRKEGFDHPVLRRYHRLLHLEELSKEQDICRHDVFNAQLHLAVFAHSNQRKFTEVRFTAAASGEVSGTSGTVSKLNRISKGMYRGPAVSHIFQEPLFKKQQFETAFGGGAHSDNNVYLLGMLSAPGLSEGRPSLVIGDALHLRPVSKDSVECVCLVASIDGDIVYLVMPEQFWSFSGVEGALRECAAKLPAGGGSSKTATQLENVPKDAFNGRVHVRFSFDRRPFMHMQNALRAAEWKSSGSSTVLPTCFVPALDSENSNTSTTTTITSSLQLQRHLQPSLADVEEIASKIELVCGRSGAPLNTEQRHAVAALVAGAGRASPYALHGPPGTGKTVTMVSAAVQLLSTYPEARLLLCAPQNYSADLLCSALAAAGLKKSQLLRLNDPRRPPYSAKEDTMDFTLFNTETGLFELPQSLEQLRSYSVVVSTCSAAALLYKYYNICTNSTNTAFAAMSHVLIDESGQALLPEALIPLALLSPPCLLEGASSTTSNPQDSLGWGALLAGDPQQLGPTVHSLAASASGLSSSLLERLISVHWQSSGNLIHSGLVPATSMLMANYRSHASLLNLPSKLFYRGQLVAAADPESVLPPQWKELETKNTLAEEEEVEDYSSDGALDDKDDALLPNTSASLMFYGVRGAQMRESDVPSFHNPLEAAAIADLVQGLVESTSARVNLSDIGIMATYRRQVQSIRLLLRQRGLGQVRVGTVDDYQGQEERIVFISTVLTQPSSLPQHVSSDAQYLGLWNNPKRFNVAITRAKALLVVVGHPAVLIEDPSWKELLRHCASIGAFRGAGADALAERLGVDLIGGGGLDFMKSAIEEENSSEPSTEMAKAIDQMASLALLGVGDAAQMFPETLEDAYASYADEMEWRVML